MTCTRVDHHLHFHLEDWYAKRFATEPYSLGFWYVVNQYSIGEPMLIGIPVVLDGHQRGEVIEHNRPDGWNDAALVWALALGQRCPFCHSTLEAGRCWEVDCFMCSHVIPLPSYV